MKSALGTIWAYGSFSLTGAILIVPLLLLLIATSAQAETITKVIKLNPGDLARVRVECLTGDCPVPVITGPYGKPHGPSHVTAGSYTSCSDCHDATLTNPRGALADKWIYGSLCPSKGPYFAPSGLLAKLGLSAPVSLGTTIMTADGPLKDPYTGEFFPLVGDGQALYMPGESARCVDCHNHFRPDGSMIKPADIGWNKAMIQEGCLYCHTGVGEGSVKSAIKQLLGD